MKYEKRQFSHTALYGTSLIDYNNIPFTPTEKVIMGISSSTVLSATTDFPRQFSASSMIVYQLLGGSDITSVWRVSRHLVQVGLSSESAIPPSLHNFNRCFMALKDKFHIPDALNPEAIILVLSIIPSLQDFDPIVIVYFFVIVVIAFSNIKYKARF